MKFRMAPNSLFAILLRSPWWISFAIAAAIFALLRLWLPELYALCGTLPFAVIGSIAAWQQMRAPSAARVSAALEAFRAMSWDEFSGAIEDGLRHAGYHVRRLEKAAAEFELSKAGRVSLVGCKRWKVARTGIEPLRELQAAVRAGDAHDCIYVAAGEFTDNARAFAAENGIRLVQGAELAAMLASARIGRKQAA